MDVGVPVNAPVLVLKLNPAGNELGFIENTTVPIVKLAELDEVILGSILLMAEFFVNMIGLVP